MRAPVVVGIDDTGSADDAVDWASRRGRDPRMPAARRACLPSAAARRPVRRRPADRRPLPGLRPAAESGVGAGGGPRPLGRPRHRRAPPGCCRQRRPAPCSTKPRDARLLVLGSRGPARSAGPAEPDRSPSRSPRTPPAPSSSSDRRGARTSGSSPPPRVVVGVDATESCTPAVGFAFQAARQRGIPLIAVHAWTPDPPADLEGISGPPAWPSCWRAQHPRARTRPLAVRVHRRPGRTPRSCAATPLHALIAQSRGAALLVVGTRGRGHVLGTVLGSVSQTVLHHGHSPVAIIRHDTALTSAPTRELQSVPNVIRPAHESRGHRSTPRNRRWSA